MTITTDLTEPIGKIRLEIGDDHEEPYGAKPHGKNLSDKEILYLYTDEGEHIGRACARCCEVLSRHWTKEPKAFNLGPEGQEGTVREYYADEGRRLRAIHGWINQVAGSNRPMGTAGIRIYPSGANPADE